MNEKLLYGFVTLLIGGAAYVLSEKEKSAKRSYEQKEHEYSESIDRCNRQIEGAISDSYHQQKNVELELLYQQSVLNADKVYAGIKDAKLARSGLHRVITNLMKQKNAIRESLQSLSGQALKNANKHIRDLNILLTDTYSQKEQLKNSIDEKYQKLQQLNQNTAQLKHRFLL